MEPFQVGSVRLRWEREPRIALMTFAPAGSNPGEEEARAVVAKLQEWSGGGPFGLLVDCTDVRSVSAGWRAVFADYFTKGQPGIRVAWFNMNLVIRVIVEMFLRATRVPGRGFASEEEARRWLAPREAAP